MRITDIVIDFINNNQCDGICFVSPINRYWYTSFSLSFGFLFVNKLGKSIFITDSRYFLEAQSSCHNVDEVRILDNSLLDCLDTIIKDLKINKCIVEQDYLSLNDYLLLGKLFSQDCIKISNTSQLRSIKSFDDIQKLQIAADIAALTIETIKQETLIGKTEIEIARMIDITMLKMGAEKNSFDTIVASGINTASPHHQPTNKIIEDGDMVMIDIGCVYDNYCSDITRSFIVGNKNKTHPELIKIWDVVYKAQQAAINALVNGISGSKIDDIARTIISSAGYGGYFKHALGHGVGLEVHEHPNLSPKSQDVIENGTVFTIEPGIYVPGLGGVRIEDTLVFNNNGSKILTIKSSKEI